LTAKKALTITILTTLTVLAYCGIMFWGLLCTGSPALAWMLGLVFAVAVILYCIVSMLLKTRASHRQVLERKKPTVNPLEACHHLALKEGQKENKRIKDE